MVDAVINAHTSHYLHSHEPRCKGSFPSGQEQVKLLGLLKEGIQSKQPDFRQGERPVVNKHRVTQQSITHPDQVSQ